MQKILLCSFLIVVITTVSFAGGPWPQPKKKGYFKLSQWWIVFDQHYTDVGKIDPNVTTGIYNTSLYAEYGITNRLTGILYFPFFSRNYMNNVVSGTTDEVLIPGEAINSVGDTDLGFKYALNKPGSKIPVSATLTLGLPIGIKEGGSQGNLQTGDGEFNQLLQVDVGGSFSLSKKTTAYASAYLGYNNRTNDFSDEVRFGLEGGLGFMDRKLWLIARLTAIESMKNGTSSSGITSTSIFANDTEFMSFGLEAAYYITRRVGVSAGFAGAFRGEIIAARPSYSVGIFYDLSR